MNEQYKKAIHHPTVTVGTLMAVITLGATMIVSGNSLENQVEANKGKIESNEELRRSEMKAQEKKLDELSTDSKDIKRLVNQILLKIQ